MGVPTSEVGYTAAMPRREDHEVHEDMWWHWTKKKKKKKKIKIKILQKNLQSSSYRWMDAGSSGSGGTYVAGVNLNGITFHMTRIYIRPS